MIARRCGRISLVIPLLRFRSNAERRRPRACVDPLRGRFLRRADRGAWELTDAMTEPSPGAAARELRLPPRWFIRLAWIVHRAIFRFSGGRRGLRLPTPGRFGMMRLTTVGRHSGRERSVIVGYYEDGPNLVTLAMT